ncbi:Thioesterase superfamily member 4, partial [Ophiophagus hannah]
MLRNWARFTHGGAIATILDSTVGASVISISCRVVTANLNINYKSPVKLGSVVLVDTRVDKIEGRKIFVSGEVRSVSSLNCSPPLCPRKKRITAAPLKTENLDAYRPSSSSAFLFLNSPTTNLSWSFIGCWKKDLQNQKRRTFFEIISGEGKGFEYAMFLNPSEKRLMATIAACIISIKSKLMTANLNIKYRSPMALGSVVVVDTKVVKIEGRKVFTSSEIWNVDGQTLHQEPHQLLKDFGVPNPSWSQEMMDQFEKFTKMSEDGSWQRMPSYNNCVDCMPVHSKLGYKPKKHQDACLFVRNVATEGRGFEFAMFYNNSERRMAVLLQPGSYLEGMIGPIPLGSVVLVETKVEKVEEKKIFMSGCVHSTDAQNLHADAT